MIVDVGILQRRRNFVPLQMKLLERSKHNLRVHILTQPKNVDFYNQFKWGVNTRVVSFGEHDNFMQKVRYLISQGEVVVRMDEDAFVSEHTLDYMIDQYFSGNKCLLLSPSFVAGVPTHELVAKYLPSDKLAELHSIFSNTTYSQTGNLICPDAANNPELGYYYQRLAGRWDSVEFFNKVREIPHVYKGIHPVRINYEAQKLMVDWGIENIDIFKNKDGLGIHESFYDEYPYLCNHIHLIRSDIWSDAIKKFPHGFDEVSLNIYRQHLDMPYGFVTGSFAIHLMYSNLTENRSTMNPHSNPQGHVYEHECYKRLWEILS